MWKYTTMNSKYLQ